MNFNKKSVEEKKQRILSPTVRILSRIGVWSYRIAILCVLACIVIGTSAGFGVIKGLIDTAPSIDSIDVIPSGYPTTIYNSNKKSVQTLVGKDANRIYVKIDEIPVVVQNAFIAIEDSRFRSHSGIDIEGIFRAVIQGLLSEDFDQGASTITQQLLKNQVFNGGQETTFIGKVQRKIQEQYLAIQLETKLSKDEILEYYLNTINLGQNTLGVQAASERYFNKKVKDLTISEASVLAGITQNPSAYNPITNPEYNNQKREIVLRYMKEQGYITDEEYNTALEDDVYSRIQLVNEEQYGGTNKSAVNSYFVDALIEQVLKDLKEKLGYTESQAYNALYRGGLKIYSTQNTKIQKICDKVLAEESLYPTNSEWQLSYQLSIMDNKGKEHHYNEQTLKSYFVKSNPSFDIYFKSKKEATPYIEQYREYLLKESYTITGEVINFIVQPQISFVLMDQHTGKVQAMVGGRGEKTGNRTLNRATGSLRQPGSTFKILSTYLPAFDTAGMTLATVEDDAAYNYPGTKRPISNWSGNSYQGLTPLRKAIYNSMNIITVKTLEKVTPKTGYDYLINLGFTSLVDRMTTESGQTFTDIQLPTALGGLTKGVSNLELTSGFASIANNGIYTEPTLYTKILDKDGNVLLEKNPASRQVMKDSTAYLLTSAMEDVVNIGTGRLAKFSSISMPVAGKTGTTSNDIDLWFVGYTPYYTAGIWGGYDLNKDQANTVYHKIIWNEVMEQIHKELSLKHTEFQIPSSVTTAKVCTKCGKLAVDGLCDKAYGGSCMSTEYFSKGTVPTETCDCHIKCNICKASGLLSNERCPLNEVASKVYLLKEETSKTADSNLILPENLTNSVCNVH